MSSVLSSEELPSPPLEFLDLDIIHDIPAARITKTAIPTPIPAFATALRPPDETFPSRTEDGVGVKVDNVMAEELGVADRKGVTEGVVEIIVDIGPTVAASSKMLLSSLQQVFSPQHQFSPPQLWTPTLPHLSAYYIIFLAIS